MERVEFIVKGSQGDPYAVTFEVSGNNANAFCTCDAGSNGLWCKHRVGILAGDASRLLSDNAADITRVNALIRGTDLETAYADFVKANEAYARAQKELSLAKKALARTMHR